MKNDILVPIHNRFAALAANTEKNISSSEESFLSSKEESLVETSKEAYWWNFIQKTCIKKRT